MRSNAGVLVLVVLQTIVSLTAARSKQYYKIVTPRPKFVYRDGDFVWKTLYRQGIAEEEVRSACREVGMRNLGDVEALVFETQGQLSVVWRGTPGTQSSYDNVVGASQLEFDRHPTTVWTVSITSSTVRPCVASLRTPSGSDARWPRSKKIVTG